MILVVGGTGEAAATVGLGAGVGPLACMGAHMYLADIRRGEGAATALKGAPEWAFTCGDGVYENGVWLRKGCHAGTRSREEEHQDPDPSLNGAGRAGPILPVWVRTCFCRSPEVLKALLHSSSGHLYGFSPVWVRT